MEIFKIDFKSLRKDKYTLLVSPKARPKEGKKYEVPKSGQS